MYRLMFVKSKKDNFGSLYQFDTTTVDEEIKPREFSTDEELDAYVEDLLNNKGYSKDSFIVVTVKDYKITADIADNIE